MNFATEKTPPGADGTSIGIIRLRVSRTKTQNGRIHKPHLII